MILDETVIAEVIFDGAKRRISLQALKINTEKRDSSLRSVEHHA